MPPLPKTRTPDPRHRYHAIAEGWRAPADDLERALAYLLDPKTVGSVSVDAATLEGVQAACASYSIPAVRTLFDASLLGGAEPDDLEEVFEVSQAEAAAYVHLFFDRASFQNALHCIAWIASIGDVDSQRTLRDAFTRGFAAIRLEYAPAQAALTPMETMQELLNADARKYAKYKDLPLSDKTSKEVRALGKHLLTGTAVLSRSAPKAPEAKSDDVTFVIESGVANPTIDDLAAMNIEIAQKPETTH